MPRMTRLKDDESVQAIFQLGILIRLHRLKKGLSQKELADLSGISQGLISRYENGTVDPPFSAVRQIAKALGISIAELLRHEAIEV